MNAPEPANAVAVARLPLAEIGPSPTNPRKHFDETYIAELAETIKAHDVIQPITVRPNPTGKPLYEIVVGECRWRASKLAGLTDIPAFWRELTDKQVLEIQVIENLQRRDVHPIEEAEGYKQLRDHHGYTPETLAEKIGKSLSYVHQRLKLTALCHAAREACYEGKLETSIAGLIARIPGETLQKRALKDVSSDYRGEPMSFRAAKEHIQQNYMVSLKGATFSLTDANLVKTAGSCKACDKRTGNNQELFGDVGDANVCTDPKCFEGKRLARHDQLIAQAEANKIPVLRGDEANKVMPHGTWSIDRDKHVPLNDRCEEDPERRTYREILGDKVPVIAIIEAKTHGQQTQLIELAEPTVLEKALKKAGITLKGDGEKEETEAQRAKREAEEAKEAQQEKLAEQETKYRAKLTKAIDAQLGTALTAPKDLIIHLAIAMVYREFDWGNELDDEALQAAGYEVPESCDPEEELPKVVAWLREQPAVASLRYMAFTLTADDRRPANSWQFRDSHDPEEIKTPVLDTFAQLLGIEIKRPTAAKATPEPLQIGDRVRVKDDARGPNGKKRKCNGREGTIEAIEGDIDTVIHFTVRFGEKAHEAVTNLTRGELEKLPFALTESPPDAPQAAQAPEEKAAKPAAPAKGKKAKAATAAQGKTTPAPATPANEPAKTAKPPASEDPAPVENRTAMAWPFPTGSRPGV